MVLRIQTTNEISPTLQNIISRFDEENIRPLDTYNSSEATLNDADCGTTLDDGDFGTTVDDAFDSNNSWNLAQDQPGVVDEPFDAADVTFDGHHEVYLHFMSHIDLIISHLLLLTRKPFSFC